MTPPTDSGDELADISPHVRIRVDPAKKKRWLEYADEHNLSLTDLIKEGVDNTINDTWVLAGETEAEERSSTVDINTSELENGMEEVLGRLDVLQDQLDDVTVEQSDASAESIPRSQVVQIASQCLDHLPKVRDGDQLLEMYEEVLVPDESELPIMTGLASDIANAIDERESHVRQALIFLETQQHNNVASIIHNGLRRWYEVDPTMDFSDALENLQTDHDVEFRPGTEYE